MFIIKKIGSKYGRYIHNVYCYATIKNNATKCIHDMDTSLKHCIDCFENKWTSSIAQYHCQIKLIHTKTMYIL